MIFAIPPSISPSSNKSTASFRRAFVSSVVSGLFGSTTTSTTISTAGIVALKVPAGSTSKSKVFASVVSINFPDSSAAFVTVKFKDDKGASAVTFISPENIPENKTIPFLLYSQVPEDSTARATCCLKV